MSSNGKDVIWKSKRTSGEKNGARNRRHALQDPVKLVVLPLGLRHSASEPRFLLPPSPHDLAVDAAIAVLQ